MELFAVLVSLANFGMAYVLGRVKAPDAFVIVEMAAGVLLLIVTAHELSRRTTARY